MTDPLWEYRVVYPSGVSDGRPVIALLACVPESSRRDVWAEDA